MEFRIQIADTVAPRLFDAIAARYAYTGTDENGATQTKQQFVRARLIQWLKDEAREHEQNEAAAAARRNTPDIVI